MLFDLFDSPCTGETVTSILASPGLPTAGKVSVLTSFGSSDLTTCLSVFSLPSVSCTEMPRTTQLPPFLTVTTNESGILSLTAVTVEPGVSSLPLAVTDSIDVPIGPSGQPVALPAPRTDWIQRPLPL